MAEARSAIVPAEDSPSNQWAYTFKVISEFW
jgi:hypothetical protein